LFTLDIIYTTENNISISNFIVDNYYLNLFYIDGNTVICDLTQIQ